MLAKPNIKNMKTRKNIRLKEYDYNKKGYYFVTICTKDMKNIFGEIKNNKMQYNQYGKLFKETIDSFNINNAVISFYQIMPNHLHIIFEFETDLDKTLSKIISIFKSRCTYKIGLKNIWQRGYYERIIRDEKEYNNIVKYIIENPYRDKYNW